MNKCTDNLTLGEIRELMKLFGNQAPQPLPYKIGDKVAIRTVTHYHTGLVKDIVGKFLILEDAAWIADTGRFMDFVEKGTFNECEPITCPVKVNTDTIIDSFDWRHPLPRIQK